MAHGLHCATIGTRNISEPTHSPELFVCAKNCGVKLVWQSTQAVWKVLLRGTERR